MLSVAVICLDYSAGSEACALVDQFRGQGYACEVICSQGDEPAPAHAESGRVRVHRLSPRRGSGEMGFAALAARRVHELQLGGRSDQVVCVDASWCAEVLRAMGLAREVEIIEYEQDSGHAASLNRWRALEMTLGAEAMA